MKQLTGGSILVVDDEATVRDVLARALEQEGHRCQTAASVEEALEKIEVEGYQVVLADILMPGRTGIDLLAEVRERFPDTKVLMVTAVSDMDTAVRALRMGASDYLTKPFNLEEVCISVKRALEQRRLELIEREYKEHLEKKVQEQTAALRETFFGAITSLAQALDAKDRYTYGHSERVTEIAVILGEEMGLAEGDLEDLRVAGLVHDIGKMGISEEVLNKKGRLTDEEFEQVRKHPALGEQILRPVIQSERVLSFVRHHHERFDGRGYPDGLAGEEIPFGARLLAVADAYDAMTSDRLYRMAMSADEARQQLRENRGGQFDPEIVDVFLAVQEKLHACRLKTGTEG